MPDLLETVLRSMADPVIAVSGGVDSMTLAALAATVRDDVHIMHAVSPAVPVEATERVRNMAIQQGWQVRIVRAGEFDDPDYRANPVNRCFYCKANLYRMIRLLTARQILSGANLNDLGEYRPGLDAAREYGVRHPFIEAGLDKRSIRKLARRLGLHEIAELPASPCLSSRVETGIPIDPATLIFIHRVERLVSAELSPQTVRCRVRANAVVIELDEDALGVLGGTAQQRLRSSIANQRDYPRDLPLLFERYRNGSAFLLETPVSL